MEDEQDQGEDNQQVSWVFQQVDESDGAEGGVWTDEEPRQKEDDDDEEEEDSDGRQGVEGVEELKSDEPEQKAEGLKEEEREEEEAQWEALGPDEAPSFRVEESGCIHSPEKTGFATESDDGGEQLDSMQKGGQVALLYTPDTDASKTSDADVPPSYSKAVSFDRLEVSDDESGVEGKRRMLMTSDSHSDSRSDIMLPSMTTELTASELLLNK